MKILWLGWEELYTTKRIVEAAKKLRLSLETIEIFDITFVVHQNQWGIFAKGFDLLRTFDILIVRTFFPYISEALTIARLFADAGKIVIDENLTSEGYAISKMHDYLVLKQNGIAVPSTWQIYDPIKLESKANRLGYPCVLKGVHGSHGTHVYKIEGRSQLRRRLLRYPSGELTLQEFLPGVEDYRVLVIGYKALPILVSRRPPDGDFRTNWALGAKFYAHPLKEFREFKPLAEKAAKILKREFAAVDIRLKGKRPLVLEVNRHPDFEGFEQATKLDVAQEFLKYVRQKAQLRLRV